MPYLVNGQLVPEELVREEFGRIGRDPQWQGIPDLPEMVWLNWAPEDLQNQMRWIP